MTNARYFILMKKFPILALLSLVLPTACTSIDCPLDNLVELTCGLYSAETGSSLTLSDTLTVRAGGVKDTTLLNRGVSISSFELPMRHGVDCDTLLLDFSNTSGQSATDTIYLGHTNEAHFESIDCPTAVFHTLTSVSWTSHALGTMPLTVDSVAIVRQIVNYDNIENLKIYLRSTVSE